MKDINEKLKNIGKLSVSEISKAIDDKGFSERPFSKTSSKKISINDLSPKIKTVFAEESIRRAVKKYAEEHEGLTVDEIAELTDLTRNTVQKHLNNLCNLREVYSIKKGKRMTLYFPNGKPLWNVGTIRFEWGSSIFEVTLSRGQSDKLFFHILEKRYTILDGEKPEGGILLPLEGLNEFINGLKKISDKVEVGKNG